MRDEKILRERLEQLRTQFLQWGTPRSPGLRDQEGRVPRLNPGAGVDLAVKT